MLINIKYSVRRRLCFKNNFRVCSKIGNKADIFNTSNMQAKRITTIIITIEISNPIKNYSTRIARTSLK